MKIMREINVKKCQILDMYAAFMQWGYNSKNKFWIQRPLNNTVMIFKQWCTGVCKYHTRLWKYADNFKALCTTLKLVWGPSWSWLHGSWIYNYLCNQCLSSLMLWVRISIRARCTTLCDKVCQWLATGRWFFSGSSGFLHQFPPSIKLAATI